jgi:hypothetical protein
VDKKNVAIIPLTLAQLCAIVATEVITPMADHMSFLLNSFYFGFWYFARRHMAWLLPAV